MSKVYSPSSTTQWKRCPVLWALNQQGIVRRDVGKRDLAAALGSAFAQAMHIYNRAKQAGVSPGSSPLDAARGWWLAQQQAWRAEGRRIPPSEEAQYAALDRRLAVLVAHALQHDPLPEEWVVVDVETSLGVEAGNARPDVVIRKPDGALVVVDYKSTLTLGSRTDERKRKLQMRLDDWRDSDQLYHYAHFVGATHAAIVLAEVEPKPQLTLHDFWMDPEAIKAWHVFQEDAWDQMADVGYRQWRAAVHSDNFGKCEMYDWCFGPEVTRDVEYTTRTRGL